jgi:hypothetical protein
MELHSCSISTIARLNEVVLLGKPAIFDQLHNKNRAVYERHIRICGFRPEFIYPRDVHEKRELFLT